jgi:hypothetical protein
MLTTRTAFGLLLLALSLAACGGDDAASKDPALAFALAYEPVSTDEDPVPGLPAPDAEAAAAFGERPVTAAVRRGVAIVGTRLWRHHAECFAQGYEMREDEPNAILDAFAELVGIDLAKPEFLPSRAVYEWAMTQEDLAADPVIQAETKRIEAALARDRWSR